jgi:plasmid stabilization system protein ParE
MRHEFHPQALNEYREAAHWYNEREPLLALKFVDEVESTIRRVLDNPKRFRVVDEDVRRCLTHVVLYTIEHSFVLIVAVMHCAREPGYWKNRLGK